MVELDGGLGIEVAIDLDALDVLFACDGQRSLADSIEHAAGHSGTVAELTPIALEAARELLANGLLDIGSARSSDHI